MRHVVTLDRLRLRLRLRLLARHPLQFTDLLGRIAPLGSQHHRSLTPTSCRPDTACTTGTVGWHWCHCAESPPKHFALVQESREPGRVFCFELQRRRRSRPKSSPLVINNRLPIPYRKGKQCSVFHGVRSDTFRWSYS